MRAESDCWIESRGEVGRTYERVEVDGLGAWVVGGVVAVAAAVEVVVAAVASFVDVDPVYNE